MLISLLLFWICNIFYQVVVTYFVHGVGIVPTSLPAIFRECIWCSFIIFIFIKNFKNFGSYWKQRKTVILTFFILMFVSVSFSYLFSDTSLRNMFIGIKYGFRWMFILITSGYLGYIGAEKWSKSIFLKKLPRFLVSIVVLGFIRQGAKLIRPDFFYAMGYGGLDDYSYGDNPPIYYLTGYEGTLRWQGLFSGPNNYGYFLVVFFPFIRYYFSKDFQKDKIKSLKFRISAISLIVRIIALVGTLSRAVLVGTSVIFLLMFRSKISKNKKLLFYGCIGILIVFVGLSILKRESTIGHITSKLETIPEIISSPLGHGLGSSGPAVHYDGVYLPENYFLQIMLDIGTIGFLFRVLAMIYILWIQLNISSMDKTNIKKENQNLFDVLHSFQLGFFALIVMGMFLHVFEDSMVNYLFFTVYGIVLGSLSKYNKGSIGWRIKLKK